MSTSSKVLIQKAAESTDKWVETHDAVIKTLHKQHLAVEEEINKVQVKLYNEFFQARQAEIAKIPHFWFAAFLKHSAASIYIQSAQDQEALTYLDDLKLVRGQEGKHIEEFDLIFTFKENPFFSNTVLTKSFTISPSADEDEEPELIGSVVPIKWKDDAHNLVKASPRKVDETDESADGLDPGSFFALFTEASDPFNVGLIIRDELYPNAVEFFAGIAEESDDEDDFEDDSEDEDLSFDTRPTKKSKA